MSTDLIIAAKENNNANSVPGDFKKYTGKQIIKAIKDIPARAVGNACLPIGRDAKNI